MFQVRGKLQTAWCACFAGRRHDLSLAFRLSSLRYKPRNQADSVACRIESTQSKWESTTSAVLLYFLRASANGICERPSSCVDWRFAMADLQLEERSMKPTGNLMTTTVWCKLTPSAWKCDNHQQPTTGHEILTLVLPWVILLVIGYRLQTSRILQLLMLIGRLASLNLFVEDQTINSCHSFRSGCCCR